MKKLACLILSLLMLICTIGCNAKSMELTLNDGVLENDYFSIDVSGYEDIHYTKDTMQFYIKDHHIGEAYAMPYTKENGNRSVRQYVEICGYTNVKQSIPNEAYMEMQAASRDEQVLSFEYINGDSGIGAMVEFLFINDSGEHRYRYEIYVKIDKNWFSIYINDTDGTEERFEGYTTAVDSFKLK